MQRFCKPKVGSSILSVGTRQCSYGETADALVLGTSLKRVGVQIPLAAPIYTMRQIAKYRCKSCHSEWEDYSGPTECPVCRHLYVDWLNYEELSKKDKKD